MTPGAAQRTPFKEERRAYSRSVMYAEPLNSEEIKNHGLLKMTTFSVYRIHSLLVNVLIHEISNETGNR
jgi:hypothetical protein